jgi:hypothetical protein
MSILPIHKEEDKNNKHEKEGKGEPGLGAV